MTWWPLYDLRGGRKTCGGCQGVRGALERVQGNGARGSTRRASTHLKFSHSMREIMPFRTVSAPDGFGAGHLGERSKGANNVVVFSPSSGRRAAKLRPRRAGCWAGGDERNARGRLRERAPRERVKSLTRTVGARSLFAGREVEATRAFEFRAPPRISFLCEAGIGANSARQSCISGCCVERRAKVTRRLISRALRHIDARRLRLIERKRCPVPELGASLEARLRPRVGAQPESCLWNHRENAGGFARGRGQRASERQTPRGYARSAEQPW